MCRYVSEYSVQYFEIIQVLNIFTPKRIYSTIKYDIYVDTLRIFAPKKRKAITMKVKLDSVKY